MTLWLPALATAVAVNVPLVYLLWRGLSSGTAELAAIWSTPGTVRIAVQSLALALGSVLVATTISLPAAWLVSRTDLVGRRFWAVACGMPLVFPSYLSAFAMIAVLGPRGWLHQGLLGLGIEWNPQWAYGYSGALLALSLFTYPYIYLMLVPALRNLDPALEESSRSLGQGAWATFRRIVLPQLRSPLYSGALLVALYALSDFGAVSIARYNTLTYEIFLDYGRFDRTAAAGRGLLLAIVALGVIGLYGWAVRKLPAVRTGPARPTPRIALGAWQLPSQLFLSAVAAITLLLPSSVVLIWGVRALQIGNPLGQAWKAMTGSMVTSLAAAVVCGILAIPIAFWAGRYSGAVPRWTERLSYAGYALPGLVIALSLVFLFTGTPLYQSFALLVAAYVVRFLPEAISATRAVLADVSPRFEEAGRSMGRSTMSVLRTVTFPLIRPGVFAGAGLVFLTAMKELPATLILRPIGLETLATRIWSAAEDGIYSEAALPALILILISILPIYGLVIRPALAPRRRVKLGA